MPTTGLSRATWHSPTAPELAAAHHCRLRLRRVSNPTAGPSETAATITRGTQHIDGRELELVIGDLGQQLLAFSRQVDLLVWGSRRNRGLYRWVLGSTSDFLAHHAHVPLLIAPPAEGAVSPWRPRVHTAG